ncbi:MULTISPECIES: hypothetical protein [unclassified Pantoea]|jgi:O-antigen ligase|uniref:hypothetical protein n=1 Tax=Pantoea TaxID=53335 RepID=UPI001FA94B29|nr:hypothetical protein [Pantoea sp. MQR6]
MKNYGAALAAIGLFAWFTLLLACFRRAQETGFNPLLTLLLLLPGFYFILLGVNALKRMNTPPSK